MKAINQQRCFGFRIINAVTASAMVSRRKAIGNAEANNDTKSGASRFGAMAYAPLRYDFFGRFPKLQRFVPYFT
ncbi:hypothetical protein [Microcoleus sp. herbarium14]|uniref:hypothetical protein n=1 Tax=Microcoleus sp. herbarium14 TaxID=3055439 RepID=UPI002FCEAC3C